MVTVHFKLSSIGKVELPLVKQTSWEELLEKCAESHTVDRSGIIAVLDGKVLSKEDMITDGDVINVFPAISGG